MGDTIQKDIARAQAMPPWSQPFARVRSWLREPFIVGPDDCPIMYRWAVLGGASPSSKPLLFPGFKRWTFKVHHFLPNRDDRDVHDHPWPFVTIVLRGGYDDLVPCLSCGGAGAIGSFTCSVCQGKGLLVGDHMRPGVIRYRGPNHAHRTRSGPDGAWTIVVTGNRLKRPWGFFVNGRKWRWDDYIETFGQAVRCD